MLEALPATVSGFEAGEGQYSSAITVASSLKRHRDWALDQRLGVTIVRDRPAVALDRALVEVGPILA